VRQFLIAMIGWAGVAFLLGIIAALQLANWRFNFDLEWITFGRLRPLHTNAAIFAFAGNAIFAGIYYSTQRLLKTRMACDMLSKIHMWGWQLIIVSAALTLPLGLSQGKEYAELEWPIDLAITLVWVVFAVNFFWTVAKTKRKTHVCGDLVLHCYNYNRCCFTCDQFYRNSCSGFQILPCMVWHSRCPYPVVVWS
jgi:cytochrome c oxidase cbb3-type subunit I/II